MATDSSLTRVEEHPNGEKKEGLLSKLASKLHIGGNSKGNNSSELETGAAGTEAPAGGSEAAATHHGASTEPLTSGAHGSAASAPGSAAGTAGPAAGMRGATETTHSAGGPAHMTQEHKETQHSVQDVNEKGVADSFDTDNEEFRRARELLDKAMEENATIDALNREAYQKATAAQRHRQEAVEAEQKMATADTELRRHQEALEAARRAEENAQISLDIDANRRRAEEAVQRANEAAAAARREYETAKGLAEDAERKRKQAQDLANEAVARRQNLEGIATRAAAVAEEARRTGQAAEQQHMNVQRTAAEASEAERRARQLEEQLELAREAAAEKARALEDEKRLHGELQGAAQAKTTEARETAQTAQRARADLAEIERHLAEAEQSARLAREKTIEHAEVARAERERAIAARDEAEKANRLLQEAKNLAAMKERELAAARATREEHEAAMAPIRKQITELENSHRTKMASAEETAREWSEATYKANMHKGKWHELWTEAKQHGDRGDQQALDHFHEVSEKVQSIMPEPIKQLVQKHKDDPNKHDLHAEHSTVNKSEDTARRHEEGPNTDTRDVFENTHANTQGPAQLDRTREHAQGAMQKNLGQAMAGTPAQGPMGAHGAEGAAGPQGAQGAVGSNRQI